MATMMPVHQITVQDRKRKEFGDIDGLADSVRQYGVLEPLIVSASGRLLAGERRLKAAQIAGLDAVPVVVCDHEHDIVEHEENERRKPFTPSERADAAAAMLKAIDDKLIKVPEGKAKRDYVAEKVGFDSTSTMMRVKEVVEKGIPELVEAMDKGDVSPAAAQIVAKMPKAEQKKVVKEGKVKEAAAEVRKGKAAKKDDKPAEPVSQQKPDDDGESEQLDGLGNPIPDCVADSFGDRDLIETVAVVKSLHADVMKLAGQLQGRIGQKCGEFWRFAQCGEALKSVLNARDQLANAFHQLEVGVPFCVCPHCDGKGCSHCRQSGYWPKERYDNREQYEV